MQLDNVNLWIDHIDKVIDQSIKITVSRSYLRGFLLTLIIASTAYLANDNYILGLIGMGVCIIVAIIIIYTERKEAMFRTSIMVLKFDLMEGKLTDSKTIREKYVNIHNKSFAVYGSYTNRKTKE